MTDIVRAALRPPITYPFATTAASHNRRRNSWSFSNRARRERSSRPRASASFGHSLSLRDPAHDDDVGLRHRVDAVLKIADPRRDLRAELRAVENAVMTDAELQMVQLLGGRNV